MKDQYKVVEGKGVIPEGTKIIVSEAFEHCDEMTEMVIPDSVTEIGEKAFMHCGELTHLVIPNSVKTIGSFAFSFCWKLKSIVFNGTLSLDKFLTSLRQLSFRWERALIRSCRKKILCL